MTSAEFIGATEAQFAELPESARNFIAFLAENGGNVDEYTVGEALLSGRITHDGLAAAAVALARHAGALLKGVDDAAGRR